MERIIRWILFGVLIALVPFAANFLNLLTKNGDPGLRELIGNGELLLISAAICAAAVGETVGSGNRNLHLKLVASGMSVTLLLLSALYYAMVAESRLSGLEFDIGVVVNMSMIIYTASLASAAGCMILSEA